MQTFLPYKSFTKSLQCLDDKRLGKQRVEAMQILDALGPESTSRWKNHPAVKMWIDYEESLKWYHDLCIETWISRGFNNNMQYKLSLKLRILLGDGQIEYIAPDGLTDDFCASHRSNLMRKEAEGSDIRKCRQAYSYFDLGWREPIDLPYVWPM